MRRSANNQWIQGLVDAFLLSLREKLRDLREMIINCNEQVTDILHRPIPPQERSTRGRRGYIITLQQIEVLRSTGMSWVAIAWVLESELSKEE